MRFMGPLTEDEVADLTDLYSHSGKQATRRRAHAILLSNKQFTMDQIALILDATRETVGHWFNSWEKKGLEGLDDMPRPERDTIYDENEITQFEAFLQETPQQLKIAQARLEQQTGKHSSDKTLKRALKKGYSFKRARLSLRKRRDEQDFRNTQGLIEEFIEWEKDGRCELYFFDESGFAQSSSLPYAWSPIGQRVEIPGYSNSKRLNVLGFLSRQGSLFYQATTERVTSDVVIQAFEGFIEQKDPESFAVIFLDNAPMHRSRKFKKMCYEWVNQRVYIIFLSTYSPELNTIELLWKKIKYEWLPISANLSFKDLCQSVNDILTSYGDKYRINFV